MFINLNPIESLSTAPVLAPQAAPEILQETSFRQVLAQQIAPPESTPAELHPELYLEIYSQWLETEIQPETPPVEPETQEEPTEETEQEESALASEEEGAQSSSSSGEEGAALDSSMTEQSTDGMSNDATMDGGASNDMPFDVGLQNLQNEHEHLSWQTSESATSALLRWLSADTAESENTLSLAEARFLLGCLLKQHPGVSPQLEPTMLAALTYQQRIDQDVLLSLNPTEWEWVFQLLPQRFFAGLATPLWQELCSQPELIPDWHALFIQICHQIPLEPEQTQALAKLYLRGLGEPNRLLEAWLTGEKGFYNDMGLTRLLPELQVRHLFLPGPLGHLQRLLPHFSAANATLRWLFRLSQTLLQGHPLNPQQALRFADFLGTWLSPDPRFKNILQSEYPRLLKGQPATLNHWQILCQQLGTQWLCYLPLSQVNPTVKQILWQLHTTSELTPSRLLALVEHPLSDENAEHKSGN